MPDSKPSIPLNNPLEPRVYTGDGTPDMVVDYVPGDDPASVGNDPTTEVANTTPPPLRES